MDNNKLVSTLEQERRMKDCLRFRRAQRPIRQAPTPQTESHSSGLIRLQEVEGGYEGYREGHQRPIWQSNSNSSAQEEERPEVE